MELPADVLEASVPDFAVSRVDFEAPVFVEEPDFVTPAALFITEPIISLPAPSLALTIGFMGSMAFLTVGDSETFFIF
ncbi:MAG TPA: hypothetical protein VEU28_03350, partial [Actinomycetota bacterium]|nr:hypothetical protein [Actinomycetota bacterium]